ncbi:NAD(P)/FAD-dependent oxidoreductase [Actinoalloteichus hymeniacidonis]|uniref:Ferredoxin--NADP reductase n=1 Tax=Actinoalloteichus hymeniacidonis TaxID=340345 RepID=A0AAC9HM17_9PSEU|nr:NAD(P)/FAD-dependent oxidoreductase [Actinoalloteichus hymeniacidonis]AOS61661.1 thioredoxin reductase [Actinoalloteichus hymeniacidonis]MBB5910325.1 thioredoxin reductase (NADPH) [Actinoalloteichus hymeniacidonis]
MAADQDHEVDLLVLGAGPAGLFAAYYAGFRGLSVVIVDALPEAGGQITAMYPEKLIFDVAGFPSVRGRELVAALVEQADRADPIYLLGRQARTLVALPDGGSRVGLADGLRIDARAVLLTAGLGEFRPRPLPGAGNRTDGSVLHFVPHLSAHEGEDVVIVGGGDSAFDWAHALHPIARSVTLVHRRARFRAQPMLVRTVRELGVPIITEAEVAELHDGPSGLDAVVIRLADGGVRTLPAQRVIAALGFVADLGPIETWGITVEQRTIPVDTTMRTSRDRIYAAGDIAAYPGKVRLIATGFGEAATAVNNIAVSLDPAAHLFPGHSTET